MKYWLKPGEGWNQLGGGLDECDGMFLRTLAERVVRPGMIGLDVACFSGWSSSQVWDIFGKNKGQFICVDWFRGSDSGGMGSEKPGSERGPIQGEWYSADVAAKDPTKQVYPSDKVLIQLLKNIEVSGALDYVSVVVADSWRPAAFVADNSVDYVYIGGDHRYTGFTKDLKAWLPKMRKGGVMCGHAMDGWLVEPNSEQWQRLCAEPEKDFYPDVSLHFGINRGLWETFGPMGKQVIINPNIWAVIL